MPKPTTEELDASQFGRVLHRRPDPVLPPDWGKVDGEDHPDSVIARAAELAERERCAKIAEAAYADPAWHSFYRSAAANIADLIRNQKG